MKKTKLRSYLCAGLFTPLLITNICIAELLNIANPDQVATAASYAEHLPISDTINLFDLFNPLTDDQYSLALQYLTLKEAGVIKHHSKKPYVDFIFVDTFYKAPSKKQTLYRFGMLAKAYGSQAFQLSGAQKTPQLMTTMAEALEFGVEVQSEFNAEADNQSHASLLEIGVYLLLPSVLRFADKSHIAFMLDAFYQCDANAHLFNSDSCMASPAKGKQIQRLISFFQGCKIEKSTDTSEPDKNLLQISLEKNKPLSKALLYHAHNHGIELVRESDSAEGKPKKGLHEVIKKAQELPGALYLAVFTGSDKYQFGVFGIHNDRLNFSYVADDNEPTLILNFSVPLVDLDVSLVVDGIDSIMNGNPENPHDHMNKVDSIWLMKPL